MLAKFYNITRHHYADANKISKQGHMYCSSITYARTIKTKGTHVMRVHRKWVSKKPYWA